MLDAQHVVRLKWERQNMTKPALLDGKIAAVTGAGQGLGRVIARQLVMSGIQVAAIGRQMAPLESLADEAPGMLIPVVADIADPAQIERAFQDIDETLGGIDILINNAAIYPLASVEESDAAEIAHTLAVNLTGPILCMKACIARMRRRGCGDIINISSESVQRPFPFLGVYAASMAGLESITESIRSEVADVDIRISVLQCGAMDGPPPSHPSWTEDRVAQFMATASKSGHLATSGKPMPPEAVAQAILHILQLPREANADFIAVRSSRSRI